MNINKSRFIAELHDIGKLVDKSAPDLKEIMNGHCFDGFDFSKNSNLSKPTSSSWWGQFHHNINNHEEISKWNKIPEMFRRDLFLLILADHLASSVSRATISGERQNMGQKRILWNVKKQEQCSFAFKNSDDLKTLFEEIQDCISGEEFLRKYQKNLLSIPEDKSAPRNLTTLYTHLELVGKIYRNLERNAKIMTKNGGTILEYNGSDARTIKEAEGGNRTIGQKNVEKGLWQAKLAKCWIKFPHSFVRLQDINLLKKRNELVKKIVESHSDEVLLARSDFLHLFILGSNVDNILKPLLDAGFHVSVIEAIADIGILTPILDRKLLDARRNSDTSRMTVLNNRKTRVYKRYLLTNNPDQLEHPICDICQQRKAVEKIKGNIREWICDNCQSIRDQGEPFSEYGNEWEKEGRKICWIKFSLDQDKLEEWLKKAFINYLTGIGIQNTQDLEDEFRPFAIQMDFNTDYNEMLKKFWETFSNSPDIKKPIAEYDELGVFKYSSSMVREIIKRFLGLLDDYFPDCSNDDSPIALSMSIANIKYPIRDHWRFFEEEKPSLVNIRHNRVFDDSYSKQEIENIFNALETEISGSFLNKLVQIENELHSDLHISIEIHNNRRKYPKIHELLSKGIKPSKFLNIYKIFPNGEEDE